MVGMPRTPYLVGTCGFSSMFNLAMVTLSPNSADSSSSAGAIMRQGPHHSAQKSTNTGFLASRTSAWKEASETLRGMVQFLNYRATISRNAPRGGQGVRKSQQFEHPEPHRKAVKAGDRR